MIRAKVRDPVGVAAILKTGLFVHVKFVAVVKLNTVPEVPVAVMVPVPQTIVLTAAPEQLNVAAVRDGLLALRSIVPVKASAVNEIIVLLPLIVAATVTVPPPDDASKVTASVAEGTAMLPTPPDVEAQCVVVELSHVPVPPTQKQPPPVPQISAKAGDDAKHSASAARA